MPHIQGVWLHFYITFDVKLPNNNMDSKANKSNPGMDEIIQYVEISMNTKQNAKSKKCM